MAEQEEGIKVSQSFTVDGMYGEVEVKVTGHGDINDKREVAHGVIDEARRYYADD